MAESFDVQRVRADFPILAREVQGKPLIYLDNAATSQRPWPVIDTVRRFYVEENANIHRGVHYLSVEATDAYDQARADVARFLGVADPREVIFVRGTTEAVNLVARSFLRPRLRPGDEILLTEMEHHANIVPWQMVAEEAGAKVVACPVTEAGEVDREAFGRMLHAQTAMVAFTHVSNVLATVNPAAELAAMAKARGIPVFIDGAQAAPHFPVDVGALGCDFYAFSGHKVFGPTGIGVLWGRAELLSAMPPYQGGGDMIEQVSFEHTTFRGIPERFEAGTPNIAGALGLGAAVRYLATLDRPGCENHEATLAARARDGLGALPGVRLHGQAPLRVAVVSFAMDGVHPHDIGTFLDAEGIAIRVGHHCAQPLMRRLGVPATARASLAFYNTAGEVDALVGAVDKARRFFA